MGRDPAGGDAFVFDLIDDGAGDDDALDAPPRPDLSLPDGAADGGPDDASEMGDGGRADPVVPTGATRWLRLLAPVAAVLAVVLGTGFALDGVRTVQQLDRIRSVRGGVADLSSPLAERWAWEGAVGTGGFEAYWGSVQVAALGDLLVFVSDDELLALEPATGAEAWSVPLGDLPDCGPTGYPGGADLTTVSVVCLQGAPEEREVMVVGPDGAASEPRLLDPADTRRYGSARPGPDGTVLRARRVGDTSAVDLADAVCSPTGECTGTVTSGRDITLRAEDAVTGAERWSVTAPFVATPAANCNPWQGGGPWGEVSDPVSDDPLQPEAFGAHISGDLVALNGCGANASVTSDGELLRGAVPSGASGIVGLSTGGYLASGFDSTTDTVVYSADGEVLGTVAGYAVEAAVVDGAGLVLSWDKDAPGVHAYEPDGTPRWDARETDTFQFAAEVGETAVVVASRGEVRGLDVATGDRRWALDIAKGADGESDVRFLFRAFTDGRHVLLLLHDETGRFDLVSLDTVSGELAWDVPIADVLGPVQDPSLVAVGGRLLAVTQGGVRGLG
ncbi:PQQ-binding-like beta-propeller repeat protein [Promicromonospora sp. NPDC050249]|uniref:outer membrane protein assembly factor BamB family protein n=1 Tax=Promicromonospora sp. NPDC050249 TaxID=3154743 RepID=UPI0033E0A64E